jgi:hypothetical protein
MHPSSGPARVPGAPANPYTPHTPVNEAHLFFGREELIRYARSLVLGGAPPRPLVLHGEAGMGKTSVLKQLEAGRMEPEALAVMVDLSLLNRSNLPAFIWDLAAAVNQSLRRRRLFWLEAERLNRAAFLEDAAYAFGYHVIRPLLEKAAVPLLLLLDRVDVLAAAVDGEPVVEPFLQYLRDLCLKQPLLHLVLALNGPTLPSLAHLGNPHYRQLGPLAYEAAAALIREPAPYHVFDDVCRLIWQTTNGHPCRLQQVCHALFNRRQQRGLRQIMLLDVREVLRRELPHLHLPPASDQRMIPPHQP